MPNRASFLYNYRENEAIGRTGKQVEDKNYWRKVKEGLGGAVATAGSRDKCAESDEGLSPTLLYIRPAVVQLAIASEDTVELLIYTSEDSDKLRIALKEHYLAESRRSIDDGRYQSLWSRYGHRTNKKADIRSQVDEQADFAVHNRNRGVE
ncbi:uncharacterized protein FOMMEDRAFT_160570 [Fomitiporia mediterranea MF3/22]|uniref:uncharacterized protein n=1 Tax=Fomitiporia mediterranea (strain MF3/22) TaxID=694068 RepID=UPI0004407596|nr:uncharacterized protein FOMMEDRAFT_160570 [Fomitiporia mediterranea MF3/22]EJC99503.1 hypothetical protein FOMMEDRAFT_160570 [Fomitiporia mediterranea MF3/22]